MKDHVEKYVELFKDVKKTIGKSINSYALVAITEDGEIFWGASYGQDETGKTIQRKLSEMSKHQGQYLHKEEV